jgi:hypothetical protein
LSGQFLEEAAKEREAAEKAKSPQSIKKVILLEEANVSGKAKLLVEKEEVEQKRQFEEETYIAERKASSSPRKQSFLDASQVKARALEMDFDEAANEPSDESALLAQKEAAQKEAAELPKKEAAQNEAVEMARKEAAEKEATERAKKEVAEKEAAERAKKEAVEKEATERARKAAAEREASARAKKEAAEKETVARARAEAAEKEATERARREAAEKEAVERVRKQATAVEKEATERARKQATEREAVARARREAAEKEATERARKEAAEKHATEATQRAQKEVLAPGDAERSLLETPAAVPAFHAMDDEYVQRLVVHKLDQRSIPRKSKGKDNADNDDSWIDGRVQKEASCEIPLEYTGDGFKLLRDTEVTMVTTMLPSRIDGPWSGTLEGRSTLGSSSSASGSFTLDYKSSPWSRLSFGMIRGHELYHPLITIGGSLVQKGSSVGLTFYQNAAFLNAMFLEHFMYSLSFRHRFPNSRWILTSDLSRRQEVSLSLSNSKLSGSMGFHLRKPKQMNLRVDIRPKISEHRRAHLFCQWKLGTWQVGASLVQSLHSQIASVGLGLRLVSTRGLEWVLSWNRGDASIRIPIVVSQGLSNVHLGQVLYFSVISFLVQEGLAEMWGWNVEPTSESSTKSLAAAFNTAKAREDAELQRDLMARQAKRKTREEADKDGLYIHQATYHVDGGDDWDATIPLQFWVTQSSLSLPPMSKSQLLGFYNISAEMKQKKDKQNRDTTIGSSRWEETWRDLLDIGQADSRKSVPSKGATPTLTVRYDFKEVSYQITVMDHEELKIPNPQATRLYRYN